MTIENAPSPEQLLSATVALPQHVVYRVFPAETVVLNLDTGKYHGVNPIGGHMLEVLGQVGSVREAADRLAAEFPKQDLAEIEQDLFEFCVDLARRGLIEVDVRDDG